MRLFKTFLTPNFSHVLLPYVQPATKERHVIKKKTRRAGIREVSFSAPSVSCQSSAGFPSFGSTAVKHSQRRVVLCSLHIMFKADLLSLFSPSSRAGQRIVMSFNRTSRPWIPSWQKVRHWHKQRDTNTRAHNRNGTGTSFSLVHSFIKWDAKPLGCYVYARVHECIYSSVRASVRRMSEFMHNRLLVFTLAISFGDIRPEMCVQRWKGLLTTTLAGAINMHIYANWGAHSHRLSGRNRSHNRAKENE